MRYSRSSARAAILAVFVGFGLVADVSAQNTKRLSAEFGGFEGEFSTTTPPPGEVFYQKTVFAPMRTLHITISATGDGHDGAAHVFSCFVDGNPCNLDGESVTLQRHESGDDFHDNTIYYSWCTAVTPRTTHEVSLALASDGGGEVFIEDGHLYIDNTSSGCLDKDVGQPGGGGGPS